MISLPFPRKRLTGRCINIDQASRYDRRLQVCLCPAGRQELSGGGGRSSQHEVNTVIESALLTIISVDYQFVRIGLCRKPSRDVSLSLRMRCRYQMSRDAIGREQSAASRSRLARRIERAGRRRSCEKYSFPGSRKIVPAGGIRPSSHDAKRYGLPGPYETYSYRKSNNGQLLYCYNTALLQVILNTTYKRTLVVRYTFKIVVVEYWYFGLVTK